MDYKIIKTKELEDGSSRYILELKQSKNKSSNNTGIPPGFTE